MLKSWSQMKIVREQRLIPKSWRTYAAIAFVLPVLMVATATSVVAMSKLASTTQSDAPFGLNHEPNSDLNLNSEPFAFSTEPVARGAILDEWTELVEQIAQERTVLASCRTAITGCPSAAIQFEAIIDAGRAHTGRAQIGVINRAVNLAIRPRSPLVQWNAPEQWLTPLVTFASGRGDCRDYAIAKFVALEEVGIPPEDLRIVVVRDLVMHQDHAIVAVRLRGQWLVLDNRHFAMASDAETERVVPLLVLGQNDVRRFMPAIAGTHAPSQ
jgi:predicted transglutaminase-like cysteine proteinase